MTDINTFVNDDYAALDTPDIDFYYGYESTYCSEHGYGPDDECPDDDCDDVTEWCFVVTRKGKEIFKRRSSEIPVEEGSEPVRFLLAGIGLYLADKK